MHQLTKKLFTLLACLLCLSTGKAQTVKSYSWSSRTPATGAGIRLSNAQLDDKGSITLAPGAAISGSIDIEFNTPQPFKAGEVKFSWLYLTNTPTSISARVSTDGFNFGDNLLQGRFTKGYDTVNDIKFALPAALSGARHWVLRLSANEETGKEAAAVIGEANLSFVTDSAAPAAKPAALVNWKSDEPNKNGAVAGLLNTSVSENGDTTLAPGALTSGAQTVRWDSAAPLAQGYVSLDRLELGDMPGSYLVQTSPDGVTFNEDIGAGPLTDSDTRRGVRYELPASLAGQTSFYLRISAAKSKTPFAAALHGLRIIALTNADKPASAANAYKVSAIDPWIEADAATLPVLAKALPPATSLSLEGPRNDWVTAALLLSSARRQNLTVELQLPDALKNRIEMRVAGQVRGLGGDGIIWDPLYRTADLPKSAARTYNYEFIKDFPRLTLDDNVPAYLWFTADLRGLASGLYNASLRISDEGRDRRDLPIKLNVMKAEIPVENPLYTITWNYQNSATTSQFLEHGVNAAWTNHEEAWKKGAKFLLFQFGPSFHSEPIDEKKKAEVKQRLDEIWEMVNRLKVPIKQWALCTIDEVSDGSAQRAAEYDRLIKQLRPQTPIWHDPAWGPQADKNQNMTTTAGTLTPILPAADIFCPYSWHLWDNTPFWSTLKKSGKRLWYYEIWGSASRRLTVGREPWRTAPYTAWRYGTEGFGVYNANEWSGDPFRSKNAGYSVTYPGENADGQLVTSRGFEGLRQGIQEYKRLWVLKNRGVDAELLSAWVARAMNASSASEITTIRREMDVKLELTNK